MLLSLVLTKVRAVARRMRTADGPQDNEARQRQQKPVATLEGARRKGGSMSADWRRPAPRRNDGDAGDAGTRPHGALSCVPERPRRAVCCLGERLRWRPRVLRPPNRIGREASARALTTGPMACLRNSSAMSSAATCRGSRRPPNPRSASRRCRTCTASSRRTDCSSSAITAAAPTSIRISTAC